MGRSFAVILGAPFRRPVLARWLALLFLGKFEIRVFEALLGMLA